jgi:hypothetical protein
LVLAMWGLLVGSLYCDRNYSNRTVLAAELSTPSA